MNTNLFSPVPGQTSIEGPLVGATRRVARGRASWRTSHAIRRTSRAIRRTSRRLVPTSASSLIPHPSSLRPAGLARPLAGFTLIEVCIAVAVAGFALVALLAVLGDSMAHGRRASDETKATLIQQRIMRDLRSQSFGTVNIPSDVSVPPPQTVDLTKSNAPTTFYFGREAQYLGKWFTDDSYFQADLVAVSVTNLPGLTRIALSVSWIASQPRPTTNTLHTWVGRRE